tara:strand:- start:3401 stop:4066 length:666 start_codon:yes stop_codon:yes gene_type:complete
MSLHTGTLTAGQVVQLGEGAHRQFFIQSCDKEYLDVKFSIEGEADIDERIYKGVPAFLKYKNAYIKNPHSVSVDYKVYTPDQRITFQEGRAVPADGTSIIGTVGVSGQPLSTDGGSITPFGGSYKASSLVGSAANTDTIITAGANVNGAIIRNMVIWLTATASNGYAAVNVDGDIIGIEQEVNKAKNYFRDYYLAAGAELQAVVTGVAGNTASVYTSYDLL